MSGTGGRFDWIQPVMESFVDGCSTCRANQGAIPAPGGVIYQDRLWRLEHTFEWIPMVGWLVLKPLRHVEAFAELTEAEAATLGPLIRSATIAMTQVLQPAKIYVVQFAESELGHVHIHLIPRWQDTPAELRGPDVFSLLNTATHEQRNLGAPEAAAKTAVAIREQMEVGR